MWSAAMGLRLGQSAADRDRPSASRSAAAGGDAGQAQAKDRLTNPLAPTTDSADRNRLQSAAWWTFFGSLLSLLAAIGGAMLGPYEFVARRSTVRRSTDVP